MKHFSLSYRYLRRLLIAVQVVTTTVLLIAGHVVRADSPPKISTAGVPMDIIGNTVFQDYNRNGNQDTGEPGFANIPVRLFQSGIERGLVLTGSNGQFSFTNANVPVGIRPNTPYEIRIAAADFPAGFNLTRPVTATPGNNAQLIGNNAVVFLTTDASGNSPSTYGIGFAAGNPDLAITTSATSSTVAKGGTATFTIQVNNIGSGTATSVVVSTTLDPGLTYGSSSPTATTITTEGSSTVLRWSLNTLTAGAPQSTFSVIATADLEGVLYNTASVTTPDTESNPTNNISRACVSVPIKLCPGDQYVASVSAEFTNVQWFRNGSSTPIASGNSLTIVQSGSYSFTTTANTSCPANGCCPVIVEDGILPNLAITPANPAICAGTTTSLTATGCTSASLVWSTGATTISIPVSPTATTVYSVTCNSTTYGTCTVSASTTVTVNPSVTATLSSATICNGTIASLTATGGTSYTLNPGGLLSVASIGSFTVNPSLTTDYVVSVTDANGCSGTATGTVTVNPSVTATLSSATICNGTVASLTATGGTSYTLNPGGLLSVASIGSFTVNPSLTTDYVVSVTDANGCSGTATGTVTVNPSVTATLSSATICNGTVASLTATGGTSYTLNPGGLLSVASIGSFTVNPSLTTDYVVSVTDANGCSGTATGTVTVNPSVTATLSSATICNGTVASLTATGGTSYTLNPGGLLSMASIGSFTVNPSLTTDYVVSVTDANGCSGTATGTVTVNPSVTATLSSATICNGTVASLTATGGTSYTLNPGGLLSVASIGSFTVNP
ncbi:SdrD B-like domain-containing protein, partial [Spirosoma arcticum]